MLRPFRGRRPNEEQIDALLSAYLDDALTTAERAELEAELEREPALRERLDELRWTVRALAALPPVEVPRNFILSPAMVAPKPAERPRRRPNWAVWGWATAVATMLFLFVLAGDFLFVAPAVRQEPVDTLAQATVRQTAVSEAGEAPTAVSTPLMAQPETAERPAQPESEKGVAPAQAPGADATETDVPPTRGAAVEEEEAVEEPMAMEAPATEEVEEAPTVEVEAAVVSTPTPALIEPDEEIPLAVSPPAYGTKTEGEAEPRDLQEGDATPSIEPVVALPLEEAPEPAGAQQASQSVPWWLRAVEIGLGVVVVGLAALTFVAYRRGA